MCKTWLAWSTLLRGVSEQQHLFLTWITLSRGVGEQHHSVVQVTDFLQGSAASASGDAMAPSDRGNGGSSPAEAQSTSGPGADATSDRPAPGAGHSQSAAGASQRSKHSGTAGSVHQAKVRPLELQLLVSVLYRGTHHCCHPPHLIPHTWCLAAWVHHRNLTVGSCLQHPLLLNRRWSQNHCDSLNSAGHAAEVEQMQAATLSCLLRVQGSAAEVQKVQGAVALDPTRLSAALLALLAVPVVVWSEYTLKATGQRLTYIDDMVLASHFDLNMLYLAGQSQRFYGFTRWELSPNLHAANSAGGCLTRPLLRTKVLQFGGQQHLTRCTWQSFTGACCSSWCLLPSQIQSSSCRVSRLASGTVQGVACRQGQVGCWGLLRASPTLWWLDWFSGLSRPG